MNSVEDLLDQIDEIIETAKVMPMMGGRALVSTDNLRTIVEDIRLSLPQEIRKAQAIVSKRGEILADARKEAESIIRKAEDRARQLVNQEEIVRQATAAAAEKEAKARSESKAIRKGAVEYAEGCLRRTEDYMSQRLGELRRARQSLHGSIKTGESAEEQEEIDETVETEE